VFLFPLSNFDYFLLFLISFFETRARQNGEPGNTGVVSGRGCKRQFKKVRTTSDDAGGKSVSEKSKSTVGKRVSEKNCTGGKSGATRTSNNPFESSRSKKPQYFVDVVKDKRTKNNNL
jgi:hypothetical protein